MAMYNCKCGKRHTSGTKCPTPNRHRFIDGSEDEKRVKRFYGTVAWAKTRETVIRLDKGVCQRCLIKFNIINYERLQVHHITKLQNNWGLRLDLNNLITLCHTCHRHVEFQPDGTLDFEWKREPLDEINIG